MITKPAEAGGIFKLTASKQVKRTSKEDKSSCLFFLFYFFLFLFYFLNLNLCFFFYLQLNHSAIMTLGNFTKE